MVTILHMCTIYVHIHLGELDPWVSQWTQLCSREAIQWVAP